MWRHEEKERDVFLCVFPPHARNPFSLSQQMGFISIKPVFADCEEKGTNTVNAYYKIFIQNKIIINEENCDPVSKGVQKRQGAHQRFSQDTLRSETPNEPKKKKFVTSLQSSYSWKMSLLLKYTFNGEMSCDGTRMNTTRRRVSAYHFLIRADIVGVWINRKRLHSSNETKRNEKQQS